MLSTNNNTSLPLPFSSLSSRKNSASGRASSEICYGELSLDPQSQSVSYKGKQIILHRREFTLLHELLENTGKVLSRQQLEQGLYGWEEDIESNALEVHIHHLRKKLYPELIKTIRGVGYIIEKLKP